jgi:hypothetical protein
MTREAYIQRTGVANQCAGEKPMSIDLVVRTLYDCNIDCGMETYSGSGVTAWVVDAHNRRSERHFDIEHLDALPAWLASEAQRLYEPCEPAERRRVHSMLDDLALRERKPAVRVSAEQRDAKREAPQHSSRATND